ncbi:Cullin-1 [Acorus calamus]|uniref:Cullin-1 n=1 Tax=Acorus calamus TaxID=4465 RepID=A0AAV9EUU6_ACOCL|nr:Cullin-1 [Acorus calamus]
MEIDHIDWEEGWAIMEEAIMKLTNLLEGFPETQFTSADYMRFYQTAYQMCIQKPPHDYSALLYERFRTSIEDYVADKVLPSLREKQGEDLLRDFARRWTNHRELVRRLSRFLAYLDRYFVEKRKLPKLVDAGTVIFEELVYNEMKSSVTNVLISMIARERGGEKIDRTLVKTVVNIYLSIDDNLKHYEHDFEAPMLENTSSYYSLKAANWMRNYTREEYRAKAKACLNEEKERAACYMHSTSASKLEERVHHELYKAPETILEKKKCENDT